MQFITLDQRIAVENFEVGVIYTVTFTSGDNFTGSCIGKGTDFVAFQRTAPELLFCLTMATAADVASIESLGDDIGKILEYTGSVPVTIKTNGTSLLDYLISGNTVQSGTPTPESPVMPQGTGERTGNLFDKNNTDDIIDNVYVNKGGVAESSVAYYMSYPIILTAGVTYTWRFGADTVHSAPTAVFYDENGVKIGVQYHPNNIRYFTITPPENCAFVRLPVYKSSKQDAVLNVGATPLTPFEPYGYKIPISSAGQTNNIYIGSEPLRKAIDVSDVADTITYSTQQLIRRVDSNGYALVTPTTETINVPELPTSNGSTTVDVDTTLKPSEIYIKYFSPLF